LHGEASIRNDIRPKARTPVLLLETVEFVRVCRKAVLRSLANKLGLGQDVVKQAPCFVAQVVCLTRVPKRHCGKERPRDDLGERDCLCVC
jgi:hypothetical protein